MNNINYLSVEMSCKNIPEGLLLELSEKAVNEFKCLGVVESDLCESEVDEIIGLDAYCGGNMPDDVMSSLESYKAQNYVFYFNQVDKTEIKSFLDKISTSNISYKVKDLKELDWNNEWKKHYSPIEVSESIKIIPSWEKLIESKNEVYIYPGMGFGTGDHATTYSCLKIFDSIRSSLSENSKVLDFGCGSGILGIAAKKLLPLSKIDFCDIDQAALENTEQNLKLNSIRYDQKTIIQREDYTVEKYDLVFANILLNVLELEKDVILDSLKKDAVCIMSGILNEQVDSLIGIFSELEPLEILSKNDWSAILFKKR